MQGNFRLARSVIHYLNSLLTADSRAIDSLFHVRMACNEAMQAHPTVQTDKKSVSILGLLNGLCGTLGSEYGEYADRGLITMLTNDFDKVVRFVPTEFLFSRTVMSDTVGPEQEGWQPEMWDNPPGCVTPGLYEHYKGSICQVVCSAVHSETKDELVIYRHYTPEKGTEGPAWALWARPDGMFRESLPDGRPRFKPIELTPEPAYGFEAIRTLYDTRMAETVAVTNARCVRRVRELATGVLARFRFSSLRFGPLRYFLEGARVSVTALNGAQFGLTVEGLLSWAESRIQTSNLPMRFEPDGITEAEIHALVEFARLCDWWRSCTGGVDMELGESVEPGEGIDHAAE